MSSFFVIIWDQMFFFLTIVDAFSQIYLHLKRLLFTPVNFHSLTSAINKQLIFVKCRFEVTLLDNFGGYVRVEVLTGNCWLGLFIYMILFCLCVYLKKSCVLHSGLEVGTMFLLSLHNFCIPLFPAHRYLQLHPYHWYPIFCSC